jgi:hypothetical protein
MSHSFPPFSSGTPGIVSSRLIPRSSFTPQGIPKIVNAVREGLDVFTATKIPATYQIIFAPPTKVKNTGKTSINPIWYDSLWHLLYGAGWDFPTTAGVPAHYFETITNAAQPIRDVTPGSGAYQNEVSWSSNLL